MPLHDAIYLIKADRADSVKKNLERLNYSGDEFRFNSQFDQADNI